MEQLNRLIDKWEKLYAQPNISGDYKLCLGECLSDAKAALVGKIYEPHTLDSPVHFKKYKASNVNWKWVIENDNSYAWWCLENVPGFEFNTEAREYLDEVTYNIQQQDRPNDFPF